MVGQLDTVEKFPNHLLSMTVCRSFPSQLAAIHQFRPLQNPWDKLQALICRLAHGKTKARSRVR